MGNADWEGDTHEHDQVAGREHPNAPPSGIDMPASKRTGATRRDPSTACLVSNSNPETAAVTPRYYIPVRRNLRRSSRPFLRALRRYTRRLTRRVRRS